MVETWDVVSEVIGWIYFLAWSLSFYPQIFINYQRKSYLLPLNLYSVSGFSIEFAFLNP